MTEEESNLMLSQCEKDIGYCFKNRSLLKTALTHTSYANETNTDSYQRLEFLGDSVVSIVVSTYIYNTFTGFPEGKLTKLRASLVCEETLAVLSQRCNIDRYMLLGVGEERQNGRNKPSILSDIFESITGAVYLDGGFDCAQEYVLRHMKGEPEKLLGSFMTIDHKTTLQEYAASRGCEVVYTLVGETGPDHNKLFTAEASACGRTAIGTGKSKKDAEQDAARKFLENE